MTAAAAGQLAEDCAPPPARPGFRPRAVRGYASGKEDYLRRLRKIEGQVRGLQKMIEADTWCPDVVIQVASATRALQELAGQYEAVISPGTAPALAAHERWSHRPFGFIHMIYRTDRGAPAALPVSAAGGFSRL